MKRIIILVAAAALLASCQQSIDDKAEKEAREYTKKYCPTPVYNYTRTDSLVFDRRARTFIYYCTLTDMMDDAELIDKNRQQLDNGLRQSLKDAINLKTYKDAGFSFKYVIHSQKSPEETLFEATYSSEDLG